MPKPKPTIGPPLLAAVLSIAPWAEKYKDEILTMIKNGYDNAQKIIAALKKKYHIP